MTNRGKRVAAIQSCYIPWRGFFDIIDSVDLFVVYDDVLYSKNGWRNRNQVKSPRGLEWLTVPVHAHLDLPIDRIEIAESRKDWRVFHRSKLIEALGPAPFFRDALTLWATCVEAGDRYLSALNVRLLRAVCEYLDIRTPIVDARQFSTAGAKTERLIHLLRQVGTASYLSGPSARAYIEDELFRASGIRLEYKRYEYAPYPQLWGDFAGNVTILDLIANVGPSAKQLLRSSAHDDVAVE